MSATPAVARMTVEFLIDGESLHDAEERLEGWLAATGEDDERLVQWRVVWEQTDWTPRPTHHPVTLEEARRIVATRTLDSRRDVIV